MENRKTIRSLLEPGKQVYVKLETPEAARLFAERAEQEGFRFGDGVKPTRRAMGHIMAIHEDLSIQYVGFAGHMAYAAADAVGGMPLVRVDYLQVFGDGSE